MFAKKDKNKDQETVEELEDNDTQEEKEEVEISKEPKSKEEEYLDGWKRCQADFDNYRKRQDERIKELGNTVKEDLVMQILPVLDNFQMSLDHVPEGQGQLPWIQGILHIQHQLESILKENGIEEVEVKEGDKFNPEIHEAIENHQQEEEKEEHHKVKKIILKGYKLGERVIRPARVTVE
jgi:molecular chaperone GrpE